MASEQRTTGRGTADPGDPAGPEAGRATLMEQHAAARRRRDSASLGSDEFRAAAEEIATIEVEIARREEPPFSG